MRTGTPEYRICPHIHRLPSEIPTKVRDLLRDLIEGKLPWPLYLHGPAGTGKTCAALVVSDVALDRCYATNEQLASVAWADGGWWEALADRELAIIDEVGARERASEHNYQALKRAADLRDHRPTVYIGNLDQKQLHAVYDDRIASRLLCGTVVRLGGRDRRMLI